MASHSFFSLESPYQPMNSTEKLTVDRFPRTPFYITIQEIQNPKPYWSTQRIEVFDRRTSKNIGGYDRGYPSLADKTFFPFLGPDGWYALYSGRYTCTQLARLGDTFEPLCTVENNFCPVEFLVPALATTKEFYGTMLDYEGSQEKLEPGYSHRFGWYRTFDIKNLEPMVRADLFLEFAFVAGCMWGDDHTDKLRVVNLTKVAEGIITVEEPFGYLELAAPLSEAILDIHENGYIEVATLKYLKYPLEQGLNNETSDAPVRARPSLR